MPEICDKTGCNNTAIYYPVLLVRPRKYYGPPVEMVLKLKICGPCSLQSKQEDFISKEGWEHIEKIFEIKGKSKPSRKKTRIKFISIDGGDNPFKD